MSTSQKYGPGKITKSNAGSLFMNAKSLYDTSNKKINMPKNSGVTAPPIGWMMSEKFDGYRAMWDGKRFVSRQGNVYNAPEWFTHCLPEGMCFDGELFAGRDNFQKCGAIRLKNPKPEDWFGIVYQIYDIPSLDGVPFVERNDILNDTIIKLQNLWKKSKLVNDSKEISKIKCPYHLTPQITITKESEMKKFYDIILSKDGEGIMLKSPESMYEGKRSSYLLKYKPNFDAEAMIIGYNGGSGKYEGKLGSFICAPIKDERVVDNKKLYFAISGMTDIIRVNFRKTHPIGTIVTYDYSGMTDDGKPRFPRYSRIRVDMVLKDAYKTNDVTEQSTPQTYNDKTRLLEIINTLHQFELENREMFKARVYKKTVDALNDLNGDVIEFKDIDSVVSVRGIGSKMGAKIREFIETGTITIYEKIKQNDKHRDIKQILSGVYGVGHVKAKELSEKHNVTSIEDLRKRPELLNAKQLIGLKYYEDLLERIPREETVYHDKYIQTVFNTIGCEAHIMGSYRRGSKTNGDIDVLVCCKDDKQEKYVKGINILKSKSYIIEDLAFGDKKYMGISKLSNLRKNSKIKNIIKHRRLDIMFTTMKEKPFALLYFTGSAELNKKMRKKALDMGYSINEHTIIDKKTKDPIIDHEFKSEKDIFEFLKMDYIEPVNR